MPAYDSFPWLRLWNRTITDPKTMGLSPPLFKTWIVCLIVANQNPKRGRLDTVDVLSFYTRSTLCRTKRRVESLIKRGLIDRDSEGLSIHNWEEYQAPRDTNTARQRRYRERHRNVTGDVTAHVTRNVTVTPPPVTKRTENREKNTPPPTEDPPPVTGPPPPGTGGDLPTGSESEPGPERELERWARAALGDRFDLENLGPNLHAWLHAGYPPARVRSAVLAALAKARGGSLVRYALGALRAPDRTAPDPDAPPVSKSQAAVDAMRRWAETLAESSANGGGGGEGVARG